MWSFSLLFLLLQRMRHWKKLLVFLPASREPSAAGGVNTLLSKAIKHYLRSSAQRPGASFKVVAQTFLFFFFKLFYIYPILFLILQQWVLLHVTSTFYNVLKKYKYRGRKKGRIIFTLSQQDETDFWLKAKMLCYNAVLELSPTHSCIASVISYPCINITLLLSGKCNDNKTFFLIHSGDVVIRERGCCSLSGCETDKDSQHYAMRMWVSGIT